MIEIPIAAYITMIVIDTIVFMVFISAVVFRLAIWAKEKAANFKRRRKWK